MKKFTTFCKMSLGALAVVIFYGCGTYNASSTSYVNGIYGRSERMTQKASQASSTKSSDQEQNAIRELPDSLAKYLNDSTYIPAPDSYEMKLRQFDKEKYEKPVNVTVVNNYLNYNPWWYSYSYRWWDPFWDPFWDPYWDPWWPSPYISIHIGPYWHDPWWPRPWYHPYYPYNPWRPAIIVPVYVREARYASRTSSSWGGGGISGGSRYGRTTAGSTYIRGNSGTASRTNSSYSRNAYSNTKSYSANIRNGNNMDKERLYDYTHGNTGGTTSYRRTGSVGRSSGSSSGSTYTKGHSNSNSSTSTSSSSSNNYNSNNGSRQRSSTIYNNSNTYNNSGNSGGSQYRRTGGGGFSSPSHSGGGGYSAPRSSGGGGGGGRRR